MKKVSITILVLIQLIFYTIPINASDGEPSNGDRIFKLKTVIKTDLNGNEWSQELIVFNAVSTPATGWNYLKWQTLGFDIIVNPPVGYTNDSSKGFLSYSQVGAGEQKFSLPIYYDESKPLDQSIQSACGGHISDEIRHNGGTLYLNPRFLIFYGVNPTYINGVPYYTQYSSDGKGYTIDEVMQYSNGGVSFPESTRSELETRHGSVDIKRDPLASPIISPSPLPSSTPTPTLSPTPKPTIAGTSLTPTPTVAPSATPAPTPTGSPTPSPSPTPDPRAYVNFEVSGTLEEGYAVGFTEKCRSNYTIEYYEWVRHEVA